MIMGLLSNLKLALRLTFENSIWSLNTPGLWEKKNMKPIVNDLSSYLLDYYHFGAYDVCLTFLILKRFLNDKQYLIVCQILSVSWVEVFLQYISNFLISPYLTSHWGGGQNYMSTHKVLHAILEASWTQHYLPLPKPTIELCPQVKSTCLSSTLVLQDIAVTTWFLALLWIMV